MKETLGNNSQGRGGTLKNEDFLPGIPEVVTERKPQVQLASHMTEHVVRTCPDWCLSHHPASLVRMLLLSFPGSPTHSGCFATAIGCSPNVCSADLS